MRIYRWFLIFLITFFSDCIPLQKGKIKPDNAKAYFDQGMVYFDLGRYTEAIKAFKQAIKIKPDYAEAHYNLGVVYGELGRYPEAIEAYK